jgi:hypothetical protein
MIPPVHSAIWKKLVKGEKPITSSKLAINLMAQNTKLKYQEDPSPENVERLVQHMYKFFSQYESVFATEIKNILG